MKTKIVLLSLLLAGCTGHGTKKQKEPKTAQPAYGQETGKTNTEPASVPQSNP